MKFQANSFILFYKFFRLISLNNKAGNGQMITRLIAAMHVNQVEIFSNSSYQQRNEKNQQSDSLNID